jgi:hypothetical protein
MGHHACARLPAAKLDPAYAPGSSRQRLPARVARPNRTAEDALRLDLHAATVPRLDHLARRGKSGGRRPSQ